MINRIYFDAVSSTAPSKEVLDTYKSLLDQYLYNSDALYDEGVAIYKTQEKAREMIANLLDVKKDEVIFTSGASEANSMAIKGLCLKSDKKHIISSVTEHHSVLNSLKQLEDNFGFEVTYLKPINGQITPEMVKESLRDDTILVTIMTANNEVGLIYDIEGIKKVVKAHPGTYFHTDITQAIGKIDVDLKDVDMASFSAHKIHGLKGSGILIKKSHVEMLPLISGGQQEYGIRGGTSNSCTNIVLAKTLRIALENKDKYRNYIKDLSTYFLNKLKEIDGVDVHRFPNCLDSLINISTPVKSEVMLNALNNKGIMVSSKSTCGSRKNAENNTLSALNIDADYAIRISFDYLNTKEEIDYFVDVIKEVINKCLF